MPDVAALVEPVLALHRAIRDAVTSAAAKDRDGELARVAADEGGDRIYRIDRIGEEVLVAGLEEIARREPLCIVAEGLSRQPLVLPEGTRESGCRWRILVDPIDGTRGLMYQKRSAWVLTGVAPNRGPETRLGDILLAVQTEIPTGKQHLSDQLWAARGSPLEARRHDRLSGQVHPLELRPSSADTIADGFATVARFFPGARDLLAAVDDALAAELLGPPPPGRAVCFEDQYASTGGQLYELMSGHDRFIADLRPLVQPALAARGLPRSLCCHPYDLASVLLAGAAGVVVTGADGGPLDAPFDLESEVAWIGYANPRLRSRIEPALQRVLGRLGLLPPR